MFYVIAGITALVCIGGFLTIDPDQRSTEEDRRVDWIGSLVITAALTLIIFVLSDGAIAPNGWATHCMCFSSVLWRVFVDMFLLSRHHRMSGHRSFACCSVLLVARISQSCSG